MPRIVVASHVRIAKPSTYGIDVRPFDGRMRFFKKRNCLRRTAHSKQAHAVHFDRFAVVGILGRRLGKRIDSLRQLFLLVENDSSQPFHAGGHGVLSGQLIEHLHGLIQTAL
jgi:hypothetical protein